MSIPINTNGNTAPSTYFTVSAATVIQANVNDGSAGCNTNSTVTLTKANGATGLHNGTTAGYDNTVFTADLPYNIQASWNGVSNQAGGQKPSQQSVQATPGEAAAPPLPTGAFASDVAIFLSVPDPTKALLAGDYTDSVTLTFTAS